MLVIRREQMRFFEEASWDRFFDSVIEHAHIETPDACRDRTTADLRALLRDVVHEVQAHGVLLTDDLRRLCLLAIRIGMDPIDHQILGPILRDPDLLGAGKLDALERAAG